jgi:hypothetical protein
MAEGGEVNTLEYQRPPAKGRGDPMKRWAVRTVALFATGWLGTFALYAFSVAGTGRFEWDEALGAVLILGSAVGLFLTLAAMVAAYFAGGRKV